MTEVKDVVREDYVHSANALFHFMAEREYLISALQRQALCPRYCKEDVGYLRIRSDGCDFEQVAVLQKCFCDIPLTHIVRKFPVQLANKDALPEEQRHELKKEISHTDLYGGYALGLSKGWGEQNGLQPVHYLSQEAEVVKQFTSMFNSVLELENLPDTMSDALLTLMCYFKPLRGTMRHRLPTVDGKRVECDIFKNFHDEREWRFVPVGASIDGGPLDYVIANDVIKSDFLRDMSNKLEEKRFTSVWLPFHYDDIRYIVVPDNDGRSEVIKALRSLTDDGAKSEDCRDILLSKIVVLEDIVRDF